jgi:hypothetical protein
MSNEKRKERYRLLHPLAELICVTCAKTFKQVRPWQKYCSEECSWKYRALDGRSAVCQQRYRDGLSEQRRAQIRRKNARRTRVWNASEHGKRMKRNRSLLTAYGLTLEQVEAMIVAQNSVCPICLEKITAMGKWRTGCAVDHDHDTGKVRGILCQPCNASLGGFSDSPATLKRAFNYLTRRKR